LKRTVKVERNHTSSRS